MSFASFWLIFRAIFGRFKKSEKVQKLAKIFNWHEMNLKQTKNGLKMELNVLKMDLNGSKIPEKFQSGQEKFSKYITHQSRVITCVGRRELELNSSN